MGATPEPWRTLTGEVRKLREQVLRLTNSSPFFGTGVKPNGDNGLDLGGTLNVDGEIVARSGVARSGNFKAGLAGWRLNANGDAEFNDLTLRGGIIGNEALTNPVVPNSVWKGTTANFGLGVAWSTLVTQALTVPSGVSSVQVIGFVRLVATNTTTSKDYLYSDFNIEGQSCGGFATPVDAGDPGTSFCSFARTLVGLTPGSTINLSAYGSTGYASWASTDNVCQISASVTWYR